jgi:hypothetical protein
MRRKLIGYLLIAAAAALFAGCAEKEANVMRTPVPPPPSNRMLPNR